MDAKSAAARAALMAYERGSLTWVEVVRAVHGLTTQGDVKTHNQRPAGSRRASWPLVIEEAVARVEQR
jgi:hypothetical protein